MKRLILLFAIFGLLMLWGKDNKTYAAEKWQQVVKNIIEEPPPFKYLPRDQKGRIDWQLAVDQGVIQPLGKISKHEKEMPILDLDIVYKREQGTKYGVVFAHKTHTYYFNCDFCHDDFTFKGEKESANLSMGEIREGKSCGRCHGKVAFPLNYCDRCHHKNDLSGEYAFSLR